MLYDVVKKSILRNKKIKQEGGYTGVPMPFERLSDYIPMSCEKGQSIGVLGATGCLAADSIIDVSRCNRRGSRKYTIEKLYSMQNTFRKNKNFNTINNNLVKVFKYDLDATGNHEIIQVIKSGVKPVYKVTTESGKFIKSTLDHKYMTNINIYDEESCFKKLSELSIGDEVFIKSAKIVKGRNPRIKGNELFKKMPYYYTCSNKIVNGCLYQRVMEYRLIYDAYINNLSVDDFIKEVFLNPNNNLIFSDRSKDIHHIDGNHLNNNINNIVLLSKEDHNKHHADYTRLGFHKVHTEKIVSIDYIGEEMTYDIMCKDPYHNFIANDFVVHNSGKSRYTRWMYLYEPYKFYKKTGYPLHIIYFPLEDNKEKVMRNIICHYMKEEYGIYINLQELDSKGKRELPDFAVDKLNEAEKFFADFEKVVTIIDGFNEPTEIFNYCVKYAMKTGHVEKYLLHDGTEQKRYIADNDLHTIIIVDNMSNIDIDKGLAGERESIVHFCRNLARGRLCNFFNFTVVQVLQQDFASERQSFTQSGETMIAKLEPSLAGVGDSKTITRSMHIVYGIFHPARFGIAMYPAKTKFNNGGYRLDLLGNRFRSLHILKANDTDFGQKIAFDFDAVGESMKELPPIESDELKDLYQRIINKDPEKFEKIAVNTFEVPDDDEAPF